MLDALAARHEGNTLHAELPTHPKVDEGQTRVQLTDANLVAAQSGRQVMDPRLRVFDKRKLHMSPAMHLVHFRPLALTGGLSLRYPSCCSGFSQSLALSPCRVISPSPPKPKFTSSVRPAYSKPRLREGKLTRCRQKPWLD